MVISQSEREKCLSMSKRRMLVCAFVWRCTNESIRVGVILNAAPEANACAEADVL